MIESVSVCGVYLGASGTGAGAGLGVGEGTEAGGAVGTERLGRAISISSTKNNRTTYAQVYMLNKSTYKLTHCEHCVFEKTEHVFVQFRN